MKENVFVINTPVINCCTNRSCAIMSGGRCRCHDAKPVRPIVTRPVHNAADLLPLPQPDWQELAGWKPEPVLTANADPSILPLPEIDWAALVVAQKAEGSNADSPDDDRGWVPPWQRPLPESTDYPWGRQLPTSTMGADGLMTTQNSRDVLPLPGVPDWGEIAALPK